MRPIIAIIGLLSLCFLSMQSIAAGTAAGSIIENEATVTYTVGASTLSVTSLKATVTVHELINATLQSQDNGNYRTVAPGQSQAALRFLLTNTGNGSEAFILSQRDLTGDNFDISTNFDGFYVDSDDDGVFEPGTDDALYDNTNPPVISADGSLIIWAASKDFPNNLNNGDKADIIVSALAYTFKDANPAPSIGDVITSKGDLNSDAVYGSSAASTNAIASFVMDNSSITVTIVKEIIGITNEFNIPNTAIPGAEVIYRLTLKVEGTGDATNLVVTDVLPIELKLKLDNANEGIINVDNAPFTSTAGDDIAEYDANTNTITVNFSTITANIPAVEKVIEFITIIQ